MSKRRIGFRRCSSSGMLTLTARESVTPYFRFGNIVLASQFFLGYPIGGSILYDVLNLLMFGVKMQFSQNKLLTLRR